MLNQGSKQEINSHSILELRASASNLADKAILMDSISEINE
jgi:hypothetical protein